MRNHLIQLFDHLAWADGVLLAELARAKDLPDEVLREYGHILGADEIWLARLERRTPRTPVWPVLGIAELRSLADELHAGFRRFLGATDDTALAARAAYVNSAGQSFETPIDEILLHVALHAQYHRGKVNLLLRQAGLAPAPADFIAFVRGAPAAITPRRP